MRTMPPASRKRAHAWGYVEPNMDRDDLDHANDKRRRPNCGESVKKLRAYSAAAVNLAYTLLERVSDHRPIAYATSIAPWERG